MLPAGGNAEYYAEDLLGSSRVTTTNNGTVCYDADFYPYGGERAYTNGCPSANVYKFEGKERDTETGNDDFGARYYSNRFGRWLSADWSSTPVAVPYANLTNPQTLNLYAMVSDDPESFADLDGHVTNASPGSLPGTNKGPSCAGTGQGASSSPATNGCAGNQSATQAQDQQQAEAAKQQAQNQPQQPIQMSGGKGGGQQPRGERGYTDKPEFKDKPGKLPKGVRPSKQNPGQFEVKNPHTGDWVLKPKGRSPQVQQRVILGVEVEIGAYITYRVIRMIPSLFPPLWETIPANLAIP